MLLAGPGAELKGKLTEKMRFRPTAMVKPLMPAGASSLESREAALAHGGRGLTDYELLRSVRSKRLTLLRGRGQLQLFLLFDLKELEEFLRHRRQ